MDGCSMPINIACFKGLALVSASPSSDVKNLMDAIATNHFCFTMPPIARNEAIKMRKVEVVDEALVEENFDNMYGIARYLFGKDDKLPFEKIPRTAANSTSWRMSKANTAQ